MNTKRLALTGLTALALLLAPTAAQASIDEVRVFTKGYLWGFWVSNIRAAVSRLSFAKKSKLRVADAKKGLVIFKPDPGKKFDYAELEKSYKRESYGVKSLELTATGTIEEQADPKVASGKVLVLNVKDTGNVFHLRLGEGVSATLPPPGTEAKVSGLLEPAKDGSAVLVVKSVAGASK